MNQIELEKIADSFDKDRSGMIDLSEIISVLKGSNRRTRRPVVRQEVMSDAERIENEVRYVNHMQYVYCFFNLHDFFNPGVTVGYAVATLLDQDPGGQMHL